MSIVHPTSDGEIPDVRRWALKHWSSRWRCWLLRIALGRRTFEYMLRSIKADARTPRARMVDIVIRQDGVEKRIEADWVKKIARYAYHLPAPELK